MSLPIIRSISTTPCAVVVLLRPGAPIVEMDGSRPAALMKSLQVRELPTYIIYKDGKEIWRKSGMMKQEEFESALVYWASNIEMYILLYFFKNN